MQKLKRFAELVQKDPEQNYLLHNIIGIYDPSFYTRYGVHAYLFGGAISGSLLSLRSPRVTCLPQTLLHCVRVERAGQGTDEMVAKYMDDVDNMRIVGVFGMTEMGHGSAIRDFETTATYNKERDTIIINTPTITGAFLAWSVVSHALTVVWYVAVD
jgi:alkylation response protein AidB-like acyl-CoA dehydrogenase